MTTHTASPIPLERKVQELKKMQIPGESTCDKVEYLLIKHPQLGAREIAEILKKSVQSIHTAKYTINKERKKSGLEPYESKRSKPKPKVKINTEPLVHEYEPMQEIPTQQEPHVDIWDQPNYVYENIEPNYVPVQPQYAAPQMQYQQQQPQQQAMPQYITPQTMPQQQYIIPPQTIAAQPIQPLQPSASFEIGIGGVDGITVKSLINVVYGKIADNRKYQVHITIKEE